MSDICRKYLYLCALSLVILLFMPLAAVENHAHQQAQEEADPGATMDFAFKVYENIISPIDGDRCNMFPSCSAYSKQSIATHGLIKGILMTADRLMRCGMDTRLYPTLSIGERDFHYDPPN